MTSAASKQEGKTCRDVLSLRKCFMFVVFGAIVVALLQLMQTGFGDRGVDIQAALVIEDDSVFGKLHLRFIQSLRITPHSKWIVVDVTSGDCVTNLTAPPGWRIVLAGEVRRTRCEPPTCISLPLDLPLDQSAGQASIAGGRERQRRQQLKNLAYLTAINGGADVILDADCMTSLSEAVRILSFPGDRDRGLMYNETLLFNPYSHFGAWAGIPHAVGGDSALIKNSRRYYIRDFDRVLVKHGLTDTSKDIIHVHAGGKTLDSSRATGLRFDPSTPPVFVGQGSYSPAVPACSLYQKEALWALLVPCVSRGPRCQLLRHFLQHRLLRELDAFVGFYQLQGMSSEEEGAPQGDEPLSASGNARVEKEGHEHQSILQSPGRLGKTLSVGSVGDTKSKRETVPLCSIRTGKTKSLDSDENLNAKTLAEVLDAWNCNHTEGFFCCYNNLATFLLKEECLDQHESALIASWIRVLRELGVFEPKKMEKPWRGVRKTSEVRAVLGNFQARLQSGGAKWQQSLKQHSVSSLEKGCNRNDLFPVDKWRKPIVSDIALVVVFNSNAYFWPNLPLVEALHRPFFKHIFYCVPDVGQLLSTKNPDQQALAKGLSIVEGFSDSWYFFYECVAAVAQMNLPGVRGYLHMGDDTLLNTWNVVNASRDSVLSAPGGKIRSVEDASFKGWVWWGSGMGRAPWLAAMAGLEKLSGLSDQEILSLDPNLTQVSRLSPGQLALLDSDLHENGTFIRPLTSFTTTRLKANASRSPRRNHPAGSQDWPEPSKEEAERFIRNYYQSNKMAGLVKNAAYDMFYLPQKMAADYVTFSRYFIKHGVMEELALPAMLFGIAKRPEIRLIPGRELWGGGRNSPWSAYNQTHFFLHPFKLKSLWKQKERLKTFCDKHIDTLFSELAKHTPH
ncbi:uncharacterized protein [Littorina saxatilis]|uniref:Uncharacterized protein n=1 Tax=Littorina saxatilis TaxID=31220 RepID=A0AAN9ARU3_9CAEN